MIYYFQTLLEAFYMIYIILFLKKCPLFWTKVESKVMTGFKMISILVIDIQ